MKGMYFVEVINNKLSSQGHIEETVGPGMWLVAFGTESGKPVRRVIPADRCQGMHLFPSLSEMEEWLKDVTEPKKGDKDPDGNSDGLADLTVKELRSLAKAAGMRNVGRAVKAELIDALEAHRDE